MTCSHCKKEMYFNPFEGETGQWCCHSCGERYDEVIERNRRMSALLSISPEKRHLDANIHDPAAMAEFLGYSEKHFKQKVVVPTPYAPNSCFHIYIDPDGTWHTHTDSLSAGDIKRSTEIERYENESRKKFTAEYRNITVWTTPNSGSVAR